MMAFTTLVAAASAAGAGAVLALVLGGLVSSLSDDALAALRPAEALLGALAGAVTGALYGLNGWTQQAGGLGLLARVGLVAAALPLLRLAAWTGHRPTALAFAALALLLLPAGVFAILDVGLRTPRFRDALPGGRLAERLRAAHLVRPLVHGPVALALLVFGAWANGKVVVECERSPGVECQVTETSWLGRVVTARVVARSPERVESDWGVAVIHAADGVYRVREQRGQVQRSIGAFLDSTASSLRSETELDLRVFGYVLLAGLLLWLGLLHDPLGDGPHPVESSALVAGGVALLMGTLVIVLLFPEAEQAGREDLATPVLVAARELDALPELSRALVEGRIAEETPESFRDFVAWVRQRYGTDRSSRRGSRWHVVEYSEVPTLLVRLGSGDTLRVEAGKTELETSAFPRTWWPEQGGRERFAGIGHGDQVTVLGQVERAPSGPLFRGWIVYGGRSLADVRQAGDQADARLRTLGGALLAVGLGLLAVYGFGLRAARRRAA